jgi:mediator of RNA polymerase II transcription subunit 27
MIEWVVVKGHGETLDLWTESRHKVFRKVTENAHAAMLHFSSPTLPELAVRSFMVRYMIWSVYYTFLHLCFQESNGSTGYQIKPKCYVWRQ